MNEIVETTWMGHMAFEAKIDGYSIKMDTTPDHGGTNFGPRPKPMVLSSLAGCTGMDVVSILKKKRVEFTSFRIKINGEMTETHPKYYNKIHITYEFTGNNFEGDNEIYAKIKRAVELSSENYCGVNAMLKNSSEISWDILLKNS